eukprot:Skav201755  [mRNA]  locus=scaffold1973:196931:198193:- [translate_table: standard]
MLAQLMHEWLSKDLQLKLPRFEAPHSKTWAFGAFLGVLRASSPLFEQPAALRELAVRCPLACRFPTTHTGKLTHYEDVHVALKEVVDVGNGMDDTKMWRLLVWIFLGNGGHHHHAWMELKSTWATTTYIHGDVRQPLSILRFVSAAVCSLGGVMKVIGSDGLDKKFRLSEARFLWLCDWHKEVPALVEAFNHSPESFRAKLKMMKGLGGDLTQKEILILLGASRYKRLRDVGRSLLPFGQGAKNGALVFLGIPLTRGKGAAEFYQRELTKYCGELEYVLNTLFPSLPHNMRKVSLGDIEPCLCGAFIYVKQVEKLRQSLRGRWKWSDDAHWSKVERLGVPAGFIPFTKGGAREASTAAGKAKIEKCPKRAKHVDGHLTKSKLLRQWGLKWPAPTNGPRKTISKRPARQMRKSQKWNIHHL